ncbi:hypothetical protein GGTG_09476 [Gaeumannomyces tritici R3-111a-1]|uniref:Uncharacterized protein n=1 Tax=Gaeumannomyces tritici (strain R3-111a-1) TaxID=644352 RepID=J3P7I5_GAET3|nr:hypothetical protein GGTG_09476 [Gaeumannomyces tritici R3-111a-1]EJT72616.1 hypothetical protein GGTG_09476 [Gaeumannomyces tritici R3-111a-1]
MAKAATTVTAASLANRRAAALSHTTLGDAQRLRRPFSPLQLSGSAAQQLSSSPQADTCYPPTLVSAEIESSSSGQQLALALAIIAVHSQHNPERPASQPAQKLSTRRNGPGSDAHGAGCFNGMAIFSSARGKGFGVMGCGACALAGPALQALGLAPAF